MKSHNQQINKPANRQVKKKPPVYSSVKKTPDTLFSSLDTWLDKNSKALLIVFFGASILFSFFLFQVRMDIGGDDSGYVLRAYDFLHKGAFPSFQGPLYPMFLSIFVSFLGIKVIFLKSLSLLFNFIALLFFYKSFKGRIPPFVLYATLLLTAINASILSFASLTYSEAFFMALQSIFLFYFFKLLDKIKDNNNLPFKESLKDWLFVGLTIFLMSSAKSVGVFALGGLLVYFAMRKQYRYIFYLLAVFLVFNIPINFIEKILWHAPSQFGQQSNIFMQKNAYNVAEGNETFHGYIGRFFQNSNLYLSKRFFQIIGLRSLEATTTITWLAYLFVFTFLFCVYRIIKSKNNYLLAASLYVACLTGITFIVLQVQWDQPRLVMIFVPLYLLIFIYGLYDTLKKAPWAMQLLGVSFILLLTLLEFNATLKKSKENIAILNKNLHGDIYCGFTPGWANYLKLSNWCEVLPKDSLVACRKGPMSSVYANGRDFFNVAKTDNININNADSVISFFKRNHVRYIMIANIQMGNTIERLITPVARTYPNKLKFIRQEGNNAEEAAQLYEILY